MLPGLQLSDLCAGVATTELLPNLRKAAIEFGAFTLDCSPLGGLQTLALGAAERFFRLTDAEKRTVHLSQFTHFRGYSRVDTSADAREQLHLGPDPEWDSTEHDPGPRKEPFWGLLGPNLWPSGLAARDRTILEDYFAQVSDCGVKLLELIAHAFELPKQCLSKLVSPEPYNLMKLMRYAANGASFSDAKGMAAHCDWSLLTLLAQSADGLWIQTPYGQWLEVPHVPGTLVVNFGEILEIVTGGQLLATPHRVCVRNDTARLSLPVFINPDLRQLISPVVEVVAADSRLVSQPKTDSGHTHRVHQPGAPYTMFRYGDSEWQRKGLGRWCYSDACC
ncbi:MAG TPA: 2OG-Fe(II) oxygenase family protein [Polyangiaceae bacterium]|jgi:isopenicillin N synthase-like dioxygenase|nr:2OG-Fe(II) oxygenase family protein [Polyangiaceae bacterium]